MDKKKVNEIGCFTVAIVGLLFGLVIGLLFTGCDMLPQKRCWTCTVTTTGGGGVQDTYTDVCDASRKEIKDIEKAGTGSYSSRGFTYTTKTTCQ